MRKIDVFLDNFAKADTGTPVLWTGWLLLFLVLFLAVKWDLRRRKKDEEKFQDELDREFE